jgi:hypothetical protein
MTTTTIRRTGQWNNKAFNTIPDIATFDDLFSVKFEYSGASEDTMGSNCPCNTDSTGLAGYCPTNAGSVGWFNRNTRCTCFTNSTSHCPTLGSNKASKAANVGLDGSGVNWFTDGENDGGCKNDTCEDGDDANYRAGWACMKSLAEKVRTYTADCTYPASTVPNDGYSRGETNELKTLSASNDDERQLLKNYCWRVDPDSKTKQPFAITNSEVNNWCTGQLDKLVSMKHRCDCRNPKKLCAECDGRKTDGTWKKGHGGCDCWNDLIHDKNVSAAVRQMTTQLQLPGADCAWMNCITPRATTIQTNLYPDKETERCPDPPKCSAVISVAKGGNVEGNIAQDFKCDSTPGPPKPSPSPSPSPSVWDKIKNFLKRVNPKVLIAPAVILAIAIIVGIFEKRKGK